MTEAEIVLADCIDLWMDGLDPTPILGRHPRVAEEVRELLRLAQAVRQSVTPVGGGQGTMTRSAAPRFGPNQAR